MALPTMKPVKSSNIDSLGHRGGTLFVRFKSGAVYSYKDVPASVYQAGLAAESVGSWFSSKVRGSYAHTSHDD